jgi:hypothetical protein
MGLCGIRIGTGACGLAQGQSCWVGGKVGAAAVAGHKCRRQVPGFLFASYACRQQ